VNDNLWKVASFCEDKTICNFIIEELSDRKCLTEEQLEIVRYLKELEKRYTSSSFSSAVEAARKEEVPFDRYLFVLLYKHSCSVLVMVVIVDLQLPVQSVPITTNVLSLNPAQGMCTRYKIM